MASSFTDPIADFSVSADGTLEVVGHAPTNGETPRNFGLDPQSDIVLVANQQTNTVVTFRRDSATGTLAKLIDTPTNGSPAWVGVIDQLE
jgi:6-phosphogluconolactonase